jgi:hypothetical protein
MASKGGDSKQGLVIALVCFVLLSLILGVVAYYGYADQATLQTAKSDAEKKEKTANSERDYYKFVATYCKSAIGQNVSKKELSEDLPVLREKWDGGQLDGPEKAEVAGLIKTLDGSVLGWDPQRKLPKSTFTSRLSQLDTDNKALAEKVAQLDSLVKQRNEEKLTIE